MSLLPEIFQYDFFLRAIIAGVLVGFLASSLGVFVMLRGMAFFSDAIAHASLTGIALGLLLGAPPLVGAVVFSVVLALIIALLAEKKAGSMDTLIGVFFSTAMALGIIVIGFLKGYRVDLFGYLFGDILGVSWTDISIMAVLTVLTSVLLIAFFRPWVKIAFHADVARVEGIRVVWHDRLFFVLLALTIALAIKVVGVTLVGPLVIIPAATAKQLATSLRGAFVLSVVAGLVAVVVGLFGSYYIDTASGPSIVLVAAAGFALAVGARRLGLVRV